MYEKFWAVLLLILTVSYSYADEGMWVLKELNKQNLERMKELGFTPSYEELYSETNPSISNAVIIFGGGCTGITVSEKGLVFTNHHCGYGAIQQLSSVEHDYLKDGFVSQTMEAELPVPGLTVRYLKETTDVSERIISQIDHLTDEYKRLSAADSISRASVMKSNANEFLAADVVPFYKTTIFPCSVQCLPGCTPVFTPTQFSRKIRRRYRQLDVATPYRWLFCIPCLCYGNNEPAEYQRKNKAYTPKSIVPVSTKGYSETDYAMTIGFPEAPTGIFLHGYRATHRKQ